MNRLNNYFENAKIAKDHLTSARQAMLRQKPNNAIVHITESIAHLVVAMNNVASIGFRKKPKAARRPRPVVKKLKKELADVRSTLEYERGEAEERLNQ